MKAHETVLQPVIEGTKQYFIPLFQRPYSWTKKEWEILWNDIQDLIEQGTQQVHFFGSIVTMPADSVPEGVTKYLLIDGQQRLTTVYVLLCLLRDLSRKFGGNQAEQIEEYFLINKYSEGSDFYRLLPTQVDRDAFTGLINVQHRDGSSITAAYKYFERRLSQVDSARLESVKRAIIKQLMVVSIVLDRSENPYVIFESLNAKGRPLTQADLIRNFVLMRIHVNEQTRAFEEHWKPMQDLLGDSLTKFIRHFLVKDGANVKESDIYFELKNRAEGLDSTGIIGLVETMRKYADYYGKLVQPNRESHSRIREKLFVLNQLEVTTGYPFILNIYNEFATGSLSESDFVDILDSLESFLVRRLVCNVPTNSLNKIFPSLYNQANGYKSLKEGVRKVLAVKNCPTDAEFRARLVTAKLYGPGDKIGKTKLILSRLEQSFEHRESPNLEDMSIEHVLPQTLTEEWKKELGSDWANVHELYKDTLGNLTLTGYNPTLSNSGFSNKKQTYCNSNIILNRYFGQIEKWDKVSIEKRAELLSNQCLKVWPDLVERDETIVQSEEEVTGRAPQAIVVMGQEILVNTWRDVGQKTLEAMAELESDRFKELSETFPRFISKNSSDFRSNRELSNGYFMDCHISAAFCYRYCQQITEFLGLSNEDWYVRLRQDAAMN